jgi:probable F420-dependent oxidoreductase
MKIRIGISAGGDDLGPDLMAALGRAVSDYGFDSLWLPEVLSRPGPDPLVGLAWASGSCPGLKVGTTMLLPGRNLIWLAKAIATLDQLCGGRFLLTFVPGLAIGGERTAVGIAPSERGALMDEALPVLRRLWAGESVSHDGPSGSFTEVTVSPRPAQDPFDVWLGGNVPAALDRCGRLADGWIPAFCTPDDAAAGRAEIDRVAAAHGRAISPEHFGVSLAYAPEGTDVGALASSPLARRARGRPLEEIIPVGRGGLRSMLEQFLAVGFSKFIVRPMAPPGEWQAELEGLAEAVGDLQT